MLVEGMDEPATFTVTQLANLTGGLEDFRRYLAKAEPAVAPGTIATAVPVRRGRLPATCARWAAFSQRRRCVAR